MKTMSAPTAQRLRPALEQAVAAVQPALAAWRQQRKPRDPIPEPIWREIVTLARFYRPSPVAHALRVNYTTLKDRVLTSSLPTGGGGGESAVIIDEKQKF
jgi:hypothetical protein